MSDNDQTSVDIFGIKPVSDAIKLASKATIDGASAFLGRICLPAAEEFGLLLQDKVRAWRANNALQVVSEAERLLQKQNASDCHAHPRLVASVIEESSWADDGILQSMWAGILASSCSDDATDDSNLIFVGLLKQLTSVQVKLLRFAVDNAQKGADSNGLITVIEPLMVDLQTVLQQSNIDDIHRVDLELDHLRGCGLIQAGFVPGQTQVDLTPTALGINLYVRCHGCKESSVTYFGIPTVQSTNGI